VLAYGEAYGLLIATFCYEVSQPGGCIHLAKSRAGGAGFAPSTSARIDTRDTPAPAGRVLEPLWCQTFAHGNEL